MRKNVRRLTKSLIFASALVIGLSFSAAAEDDDFNRRYTSPDQERSYDYNYRENTGGERDHRYMPNREYQNRGMNRENRDYRGYYDERDDYDYNYRENTGGSMDNRYMPRDERRGHRMDRRMMDRNMDRGYYDEPDDYDYNYRENTGGSRDSRFGPEERQ